MCNNTKTRRRRGSGSIIEIEENVKYKIRVGRGHKADGSLRQKSETIYGTRALAEWRAEQLYEELGRDIVKGSGYTLAQYYERVVIPSKAATTKANQDGYSYAWQHVPDAWKRGELRDIPQTEVQAWVDGLSSGTASACVRHLRAILRQAHGDGLIQTEPMDYRVRIPKKDHSSKKMIWDEQDMAEALMAVRGSVIEPYILIVCGTGCRREEAMALDWCNIDFVISKKGKVKSCWVTIESAYTETDGEHITKTEHSVRRVPIVGYIASRLYELRSDGPLQKGIRGRLTVGGLRRRWKNLWRKGGAVRKTCTRLDGVLLAASIPEITPNACRHSHISLMSELGIPIQTNHLFHGHTDSDIQTRHYLKRYDKRLLRAAKTMAKAIEEYL